MEGLAQTGETEFGVKLGLTLSMNHAENGCTGAPPQAVTLVT